MENTIVVSKIFKNFVQNVSNSFFFFFRLEHFILYNSFVTTGSLLDWPDMGLDLLLPKNLPRQT